MCLQHRRSDSKSTATVFQCIWCQVAAKCFVQQAASPGGKRLIVRAFTTCGAKENTVFDPSIGPKYLPCSNRESRGPRHPSHSLTKLCQGENSAPSHVSFGNCLAVSTHCKPTVHAGCTRHKPRQQVLVCWHFHTRSRLHCQFDQSDMSFDEVY